MITVGQELNFRNLTFALPLVCLPHPPVILYTLRNIKQDTFRPDIARDLTGVEDDLSCGEVLNKRTTTKTKTNYFRSHLSSNQEV